MDIYDDLLEGLDGCLELVVFHPLKIPTDSTFPAEPLVNLPIDQHSPHALPPFDYFSFPNLLFSPQKKTVPASTEKAKKM
jgi:hypothetical protein